MRTKIDVRALQKSFSSDRGRLPVIEDVSLTVGEGEFVAIVGPSGCGKSTLLNLMAGFIPPDAGLVAIDGKQHSKPDQKGILISQQGSVFPWLTVRENLKFGLNGTAQTDHAQLADHHLVRVLLVRVLIHPIGALRLGPDDEVIELADRHAAAEVGLAFLMQTHHHVNATPHQLGQFNSALSRAQNLAPHRAAGAAVLVEHLAIHDRVFDALGRHH